MRKKILRFFIALSVIAIIIALGLGYAVLITQYGIGLHCPIRANTGISCPFCGLTRMSLAIIRFIFVNHDFNELAYAYSMNQFVIYMSPFIVYLLGRQVIYWINEGKFKGFDKTDNVLFILVLIVMIMWTLFRNIFVS